MSATTERRIQIYGDTSRYVNKILSFSNPEYPDKKLFQPGECSKDLRVDEIFLNPIDRIGAWNEKIGVFEDAFGIPTSKRGYLIRLTDATQETIQDIGQNTNVSDLIQIYLDESSTANHVLNEEYVKASDDAECVFSLPYETLLPQLDPVYRNAYESYNKSVRVSKIARASSGDFLLTTFDPDTKSYSVFNLSTWDMKNPGRVRKMLTEYYVHQTRAQAAFGIAERLVVHSESAKVEIPQLLEELAEISDPEIMNKRFTEFLDYIDLLQNQVYKNGHLWYYWSYKLVHNIPIEPRVIDRTEVITLQELLQGLSTCSGIPEDIRKKRAIQSNIVNFFAKVHDPESGESKKPDTIKPSNKPDLFEEAYINEAVKNNILRNLGFNKKKFDRLVESFSRQYNAAPDKESYDVPHVEPSKLVFSLLYFIHEAKFDISQESHPIKAAFMRFGLDSAAAESVYESIRKTVIKKNR